MILAGDSEGTVVVGGCRTRPQQVKDGRLRAIVSTTASITGPFLLAGTMTDEEAPETLGRIEAGSPFFRPTGVLFLNGQDLSDGTPGQQAEALDLLKSYLDAVAAENRTPAGNVALLPDEAHEALRTAGHLARHLTEAYNCLTYGRPSLWAKPRFNSSDASLAAEGRANTVMELPAGFNRPGLFEVQAGAPGFQAVPPHLRGDHQARHAQGRTRPCSNPARLSKTPILSMRTQRATALMAP